METIEMDLMQAQIGELTTEVSVAKSKIAKIPAIPTPENTDAGKAIIVGDDGKYELGEVSGGSQVYEFSLAVQNAMYSTVESAVTACITSGNTSAASNSLESVVTNEDFATAESALAQAGSGLLPVFTILGGTYCCPTTITKNSINDNVAISLLTPNYSVYGKYIRLTFSIIINSVTLSSNLIHVIAEPFYTE